MPPNSLRGVTTFVRPRAGQAAEPVRDLRPSPRSCRRRCTARGPLGKRRAGCRSAPSWPGASSRRRWRPPRATRRGPGRRHFVDRIHEIDRHAVGEEQRQQHVRAVAVIRASAPGAGTCRRSPPSPRPLRRHAPARPGPLALHRKPMSVHSRCRFVPTRVGGSSPTCPPRLSVS